MDLCQTLSDKILQLFSPLNSLAHSGTFVESEPDSHANSHIALGQLFLYSGKCVFGQNAVL